MGKTTTIQIRVDEDLKKKVAKVAERVHMSMSQIIKMALRRIADQGRIPLEYIEFNEETKRIMDEVDAAIGLHEVNSVEELFEELER